MDSQTNTGGGAAIGGKVRAGEFVGRDKLVYNINVVGSLLHFAQIEGIFPKFQRSDNFASLTKAVESALGARLSSDLAEATAFAGEILGDFIPTQIPSITAQGSLYLKRQGRVNYCCNQHQPCAVILLV